MTDTWIALGGRNNAVRLLLKGVSGSPGIGLGQLRFVVEATPRRDEAVGRSLWLGGELRVTDMGALHGFLASLHVDNQPIVLPERGGHREITLKAEIGYNQLQVIEDFRSTGVKLHLDLSGHSFQDGEAEPFWGCQIDHEVRQSDWTVLMETMGYKRLLLIELDAPDAQRSPAMADAVSYFKQAEKHYAEHEWRLTVESLRQCLAALVGERPEDEDKEADVLAAVKTLKNQAHEERVGYDRRYEPVRRALKFLCDLSAHPEVAETRKHDAYAGLVMAVGLLHGFGRS